MEGYSVTEAATILGVPTERVWELLARGVLAGTSEGEAGMRVYLQPRPAPAPASIAPGRPNGNDEPREPERELSPFRELLTEFRNLTERYGQALLALGESRGEVATLRSRVDLLEARMDLRLPMSGFTPPTSSSPWPSAPVTTAVVPPPPESAADEHGADEVEDEHDRPTRRRRSSQRRATESFAEALARAEDPTRSELPGAGDVATALAALRDDAAHAAAVTATEAVLPRELPAADLMPFANEEPEPAVIAAEPEPVSVAAEQPGPEPESEVPTARPEPVAVEHPQPEPEPESVAAEPEPVAVEPDLVADAQPDGQPQLEPEPVAGEPKPVALEQREPEPAVAAAESEAAVVEAAGVEAAVSMAEHEPMGTERPEAGPETVAAEQLEPEPETVATEHPEVVADVISAQDAALPIAEAAEVETEPRPLGEEPKAEDVAGDGEPGAAGRATTTAEAEPATDEPEAPEPIAWDRERYTVVIEEPDWFAGEEPQASDQLPPDEEPAIESDVPGPELADAATALPEAAPAMPEPARPPSPAHRDEETMLWFGRQPAPPAAGPAEEPPAADEGPADDGASEMEMAGSGHHAQMPGSQELEDALAALNALGTERSEPASTASPDEPVEETAAEAWPRADTSAWTPPRESSETRAAVTPASRAYRRLRRIFPG